MTAAERQELIMATLRRDRRAKIDNLASALDCSERTIRRDIEALTASFPLETSQGRYDGGVKLAEGYHPQAKALGPEQIIALREAILNAPNSQSRMALSSILDQFSPTR